MFVVEEVVGVVALDFADLLRAEAELLGVAVGRGGGLYSRVQCVETISQSINSLVESAEDVLDRDRGRSAGGRHCRLGGGGSECG